MSIKLYTVSYPSVMLILYVYVGFCSSELPEINAFLSRAN